MQHLKVSGAVWPLKWSLGVRWLINVTGNNDARWKPEIDCDEYSPIMCVHMCEMIFTGIWLLNLLV